MKKFFCRVGNPGKFNCIAAVFSNGAHDVEISGNIFMECEAALGNNHREGDKEQIMRKIKSI